MRDSVRAVLLSIGVGMVCLGWGLQQGAVQSRIALGDKTQREFWFKGWSVLDPVKSNKGLESRFDLGSLTLAVGAALVASSWRFPKRP